jgi:hypothetical protein
MVASLGCFFAHLSYSLRIVRLASSFFMLAMQTPSGRNICLDRRFFYEANMTSWGTRAPFYRQYRRTAFGACRSHGPTGARIASASSATNKKPKSGLPTIPYSRNDPSKSRHRHQGGSRSGSRRRRITPGSRRPAEMRCARSLDAGNGRSRVYSRDFTLQIDRGLGAHPPAGAEPFPPAAGDDGATATVLGIGTAGFAFCEL